MRALYFVIVVAAALSLPWWVFFLFALPYAFSYRATELLIPAILTDALFGGAIMWLPIPAVYTIFTAILLIGLSFLKPFLSFHEDSFPR